MNIKSLIAKLRMRKIFLKGDIIAFLSVLRKKGLKVALRHFRLCGKVYFPWFKLQIENSGIFDRDFYIEQYVKGEVIIDPFEHYVKRGIHYDLRPNSGFSPVWHRIRYMPSNSRISPALHYALNLDANYANAYPPFERRDFSSRFLDVFNICRKYRIVLDSNSKILDFGCGEGDTVAAFCESGFDAYGYDIVARLNARAKRFQERFSFNEGAVFSDPGHPNVDDYVLADKNLILPYPDNSFDILFSYQVFEHVFNLKESLAEIARILKPGGIAWHIFPPESCFMERHTTVPLGHRIHKRWYYNLMGALGIAGRGRIKGERMECARIAYDYVGSATSYNSIARLRATAAEFYKNVNIFLYPDGPVLNPVKAIWRNLFPANIILLCGKDSNIRDDTPAQYREESHENQKGTG